jgi:hypothetical protein
MTVVVLLAVIVAAQQNAANNGWHIYSPNGASFSIQVPGVPLPAQGHIFDPSDNEMAHRLIEHGLRSKTYNFEIKPANKESFLVSILEVQTTECRPHKFITDSEVELINTVIADGIVHSKVARRATENGEISRWSYNRKAGLGDDDEDDGMVYVRRWNNYLVIVVVEYQGVVSSGDADVKAMLDSLHLREGGAMLKN